MHDATSTSSPVRPEPPRPLRSDDRPATIPRERRSRLLDEQAASIAHGLNNLLAAVVDQSARLLAASSAPDAAEQPSMADDLRLIHQAALDGATLARRLLMLSRGEAAHPAGDPGALEIVEVGRVLADAVDLTRPRWHDETSRRGAPVHVAVEVAGPLLVRGVPADLREIVVNLILNAVDAMPSGGRLRLRGDREGGSVTIRCQDSGIGMAPETRRRIFKPFFTTKGAAGTGVGLAIARAVVARHGGEIQVVSEPGLGTTFTIRLPAVEPSGLSRIPHASPESARRSGGAGHDLGSRAAANGHGSAVSRHEADGGIVVLLAAERAVDHSGPSVRARAAARAAVADELAAGLASLALLVVDDDPIFRAVFARRLELDARRVEAVGDGTTALARAASGGWDVICLDDGLPDVSGRDLAAEIRRRGLPCAVVLVTGTATSPDDPSFVAPGVDAVLPKPCTDAELARALRMARAQQHARGV